MSCIKKLKMANVKGQMKLLINISKYLVLSLHKCIKLFKMILDTGNMPESWLIGVIKPLKKIKELY